MSTENEKKKEIIESYRTHEGDTGSPQVQIALMSDRIRHLTEHLKANPKDYSSRRGLLKVVCQRRGLLQYLKVTEADVYYELIKRLELSK